MKIRMNQDIDNYEESVLACYVVVVAVAPLALAGFYHLHDMGFLEVLRRFVLSFFAKPLLYETAAETKEGVGKRTGKRLNQAKGEGKKHFQRPESGFLWG